MDDTGNPNEGQDPAGLPPRRLIGNGPGREAVLSPEPATASSVAALRAELAAEFAALHARIAALAMRIDARVP